MEKKYRMIEPSDKTKENEDGIVEKCPKSDPISLINKQENIRKTKNVSSSEDGKYKCFAISHLFDDLFRGFNKYNSPIIIKLNNTPKTAKSIISFLLPENLLNNVAIRIKEKDTIQKNKRGHSVKQDHYAYFLNYKSKDNIFSDCLYDVYNETGWRKFIESIKEHIIKSFEGINLSGNNNLIDYLDEVGSVTIVPKEKSPKSNEAFVDLLNKGKNGDSNAIAIIIANFFISSILGLRSMSYEPVYTAKLSLKTYILSSTGMERIWRPDLISPPYERLFDSRRLFENANYEGAKKTIEEWLKEYEQEASNEAKALAYQILGTSLYNLSSSDDEKGKDGQSKGIEYLKKCISTDEADLYVFYSLYDKLKESSLEEAIGYLKTAFALNYAKAVIEVASLYLEGTYVFDDVTEDTLLKKINYVIEHERRNDVDDVGKCLYLHGRFAKSHGNETKANEDFEAASKRGNERARQEITRKKRNERNSFPSFVNDENAPCCYTNTFTGNNYAVVSTFPSETWVMYTPDNTDKKDIIQIRGIEEFVEKQNNSGFGHSRLVFLLMSKDEEKNLNECLILLDKLFNIVLDKSEDEKWKIIDAIDIFVSAKYETASMLIDANISDMGSDIYFKVHIMDEGRDTVHKLLCEAPLFLPALKKDNNKTEVVLFGSSEMNYNFIKESVACAYLEPFHTIRITLLGEKADALENKLYQECPGIYNENPHISCIRPKFIKCSIKDTDFPSYIYGKICAEVLSGECESFLDTEIVNSLLEANYFVVDYADDLENIKFSADLRTWLLRSKGTFKRAPFIGVKCSDEQNAYLASHLTLSGQASGNSYFNKYDLFPIGISAQTYSYENLINHPILNDFALRIHKSYYGDKERAAENDFYSYSYNSDSSISTAIGLCYRFFAAGVIFNDKDKYLNFGFFKTSGIETRFEEKYKEKLENLAALEQSRWNGFMLSRGWESANQSEVQVYKEQSTGWQHKHILAKKHPFIREWEDLDTPKLTELLNILKSKFDYDRQPQVTTKKSIEDTAKFFNTAEKTDEKLH